jgi:hypothetical protein
MSMIRHVKNTINKVFNPSSERQEDNMAICNKCSNSYPKSWHSCPYCKVVVAPDKPRVEKGN